MTTPTQLHPEQVGISCGSVTVRGVYLNGTLRTKHVRHGGDIGAAFGRVLKDLGAAAPTPVVVTGRVPLDGHAYVTEPAAVQRALKEYPSDMLPQIVVSLGGQTLMGYQLDETGSIVRTHTFNRCGSGTGEFLIQQVVRLGFATLSDAAIAAMNPEAFDKPFCPAKRCSVFCKSDCTHAANEGKATPAQIAAGLFKMVADKAAELADKAEAKRIWLIGGGSTLKPILEYVRRAGYDVATPPCADHFEAFGAALLAKDGPVEGDRVQAGPRELFPTLPPLESFRGFVRYASMPSGVAAAEDECILSIDVGSTTTKMVLCRTSDLAIVASHYGYTLGKPHRAILEGLAEIEAKLGVPVAITGIIVTGSGRKLAEAFLTDYALQESQPGHIRVVNEISCHAEAARYLNPDVRCVLEIGGQDAKWTYIVDGVPTDFAMNEACSAGTGSFMAEVVKEMFGIADPRHIAPIALLGERPVGFGDQCSAFIESDVNTALQNGISQENVVAGLCYSICTNYVRRVVGNRPIQGPILVQGGTAYNEAFCLAMAATLRMNGILADGESIIVPREAGLMGAIGGAVFLRDRMRSGEYKPMRTSIGRLLTRDLREAGRFECRGCDYKCSITNFLVSDDKGSRKVPFGGFCRRFENIRHGDQVVDTDEFDLISVRDRLLFEQCSDFGASLPATATTVGLTGNFFDLTYLPLVTTMFAKLGLRPVLAKEVDPEGSKRQGAAFCWPVERSHGLMASLISMKPDWYWLPHIHTVKTADMRKDQCCTLAQGTGFLMQLEGAFPELDKSRVLSPYLRITDDVDELVKMLLPVAAKLGKTERELRDAVIAGLSAQRAFKQACKDEGAKALARLKANPNEIAFVMVGRPYNAYSNHLGSNKGLSRKVASMGILVIPADFLPYESEPDEPGMYWSAGQDILRAARFIAKHPRLYPVFLTNFSCGPDSFLVTKFRHYLKGIPSLVLEFDAHTANAGFDTRIEAYWEIVKGFVRAGGRDHVSVARVFDGSSFEADPRRLSAPGVEAVIPDMGTFYAEAFGAVMESEGVRVRVLPEPGPDELALGRKHSSCKECVPFGYTMGSFLAYLGKRPADVKHSMLFMPNGSGPCRFGQYNVHLRMALDQLGIDGVSVLSLTDSTAYGGLGPKFREKAWIALVCGSTMENIDCAVRALARDPAAARAEVRASWERIKGRLRQGVDMWSLRGLLSFIRKEAKTLARIPLVRPFKDAPKAMITGEIYVRLSNATTGPVVDYIGERGIVAVKEPATNWLKYLDYLMAAGYFTSARLTLKGKALHWLKRKVQGSFESSIVKAFALSGLCSDHTDDVDEMIEWALPYLSDRLGGEAILTVGGARAEALHRYAGIVAIGPFGCMPTRLASGILAYSMSVADKEETKPGSVPASVQDSVSHCPYITLEVDGTPLSPVARSGLDALCVMTKHANEAMLV